MFVPKKISDKISDSLATTTIDTVQKVGEGKVQAALARAEFKEATEEKVKKSKNLHTLLDKLKRDIFYFLSLILFFNS